MVSCSAGIRVVGRQSACLLVRLSGGIMLAVPWFFLGAGCVGMPLNTCSVARHSACTVSACVSAHGWVRVPACTRWWLVALPVCKCRLFGGGGGLAALPLCNCHLGVCGGYLAVVGCVLKHTVLSSCRGWGARALSCSMLFGSLFCCIAAHTASARTAMVLAQAGPGASLAAESRCPL